MPAGRAAGPGPLLSPGAGRHGRLFRRAVATRHAKTASRQDHGVFDAPYADCPLARHRAGDHGERRPGPAARRPDRPALGRAGRSRPRRRAPPAATTRRSTCSRPRSPSIRATAPPISRSAGSPRRSACPARRSAIYAEALQLEPNDVTALAGQGEAFVQRGAVERAKQQSRADPDALRASPARRRPQLAAVIAKRPAAPKCSPPSAPSRARPAEAPPPRRN